ncbi:Rho termination factor N-terminal domain-containing protein, partial [Streptosporangium sp. NPDC006013]|uniref:Rho termination factor N-terminal domain-containing protein n=1 Tax=Streptosporangium sp. NPDC006013 TaxID=3155596 RepID=UPI0033B50C73
MSDTTELLSDVTGTAPASGDTPTRPAAKPRRRSGTGLSAMVLPELQAMASGLGISGTGRMRKSQLIAAIQEKQGVSAESAQAPVTAKETPAVAVPAVAAEPVVERPARTRRERSRPVVAAEPVVEQAPPAPDPVAAVVAPEPVVEQQTIDAVPAEGRGERGESRRERGERRGRGGERGERGERVNDRRERGDQRGDQRGEQRGEQRTDSRAADAGQTHWRLPGSTRRKVGMTSSHHAPYVLGCKHAT